MSSLIKKILYFNFLCQYTYNNMGGKYVRTPLACILLSFLCFFFSNLRVMPMQPINVVFSLYRVSICFFCCQCFLYSRYCCHNFYIVSAVNYLYIMLSQYCKKCGVGNLKKKKRDCTWAKTTKREDGLNLKKWGKNWESAGVKGV